MKTVTFAREYRHKLDGLRTVIYPADYAGEVTNEIAAAAKKARALKPEPKKAEADGE